MDSQENQLLEILNAHEKDFLLEEAITPLLSDLASVFHHNDINDIARVIISGRSNLRGKIYENIEQLIEVLLLNDRFIDQFEHDLTKELLSKLHRLNVIDDILKFVNTVSVASDLETFIKPHIKFLTKHSRRIKLSEITEELLDWRNNLPDKKFRNIKQVVKVIIGVAAYYVAFEKLRLIIERALLKAPWDSHPVLLLPIRIETRFDLESKKLLIRFYPDQISIDTHNPQLSSAEYDAIKDYYVSPDHKKKDAWRILSSKFGPNRAHWLVDWGKNFDFEGPPPQFRTNSWTSPPSIKALPDYYCAYVYRGDNVIRKLGNRVNKNSTMMGSFRNTVQLELSGDPSTNIPVNSIVIHNETGILWRINKSSTIGEDGKSTVIAAAMTGSPTIESTDNWTIQTPIDGWQSAVSITDSSLIDGLFDESSKWVYDFPTAVRDGYAVEIGINDQDIASGFDKIIVVGVQWSNNQSAQNQLENLFKAHEYTSGLGFIKPETPTNNTDTESSGFSSAQNHDESFNTNILGPANWVTEEQGEKRTNAHLLAKALGMDATLFRFLENAGVTNDTYAKEINALTWPSTGDYYLRHLLEGTLSNESLFNVSSHHYEFVRGGGPLPTIRVGKQPYGILPVTRILSESQAEGGWLPWNGDLLANELFDQNLHGITTNFYRRWLAKANNRDCVPRVITDDLDADQTLLKILAMQPRSMDFKARPYLDERFIAWLLVVLRDYAYGADSVYHDSSFTPVQMMSNWSELWEQEKLRHSDLLDTMTRIDNSSLTGRFSDKPLFKMLSWFEGSERDSFTQDTSDNEPPHSISDYLKEIINTGSTDAESLLSTLAQRALSISPDSRIKDRAETALQKLGSVNVLEFFNSVTDAQQIVDRIQDDPDEHPEREGYGVRYSVAQRILNKREQLGGFTSLDQIDEVYGIGPDTLHDIKYSFKGHECIPEIDRLFRESIDLATHRVDAWVTSFANKRLKGMRQESHSPDGIHIGAYGYVEDLQVRQAPQSEGYLHAPSSEHAAASAILYNAYMTHDQSQTSAHSTDVPDNPFRINLTSHRVRHSLRILQGIREGQSLGALLGYRFERSLKQNQLYLAQYIDDLREIFPIVANKLTPTETDESTEVVAARTVLDGATLTRIYRGLQRNPDGRPNLNVYYPQDDPHYPLIDFLRTMSNQHSDGLYAELKKLDDLLDAVNDLMLSEGVYQAVQGNYDRAGAVLAASSGDQIPPEIEIASTPVSGNKYSHRVCMLFNNVLSVDENHDPRAAAEPRVSAWFSELLGELSDIGVGFDFWEEETEPEILNLINVNTADAESLEELPHVSTAVAEEIIAEREKSHFRNICDLIRVSHISDNMIPDIYPLVTTGYIDRININTAPKDLLVELSGIGSLLADDIIAARPFNGIEDLTRVSGVGQNILNTLRSQIVAPLTNLNTANQQALENIPHIGPVIASRIITVRQQKSFSSLTDLLAITDVTPELLEQITSYVSTDFGIVGINELNVDNDPCFSATDFFYASQNHNDAGASEIEQRISQLVRRRYGLSSELQININSSNSGNYNRSLADAVELGKNCHRLLSAGTALKPEQVSHPGDIIEEGYSAEDVAALRSRVIDVQRLLSFTSQDNQHSGLIHEFPSSTFTTKVKLTGTPDTVIPQGTRLIAQSTGTLWITTEEITLLAENDSDTLSSLEVIVETIAELGQVSCLVGASWQIEQPIEGIELVEVVEESMPASLEDISIIMRRAAQFGIPGATLGADSTPMLSSYFDNVYEELQSRLKKSLALTPRLNVNTLNESTLVTVLDDLNESPGDNLAETTATTILQAKPENGFPNIEAVTDLFPGNQIVIESIQHELTTVDIAPSFAINKLIEAMKTIFGKSFIVLPTFAPQGALDLANSLSLENRIPEDKDPLRGLGEDRLRLWLQQTAEVQPAISSLENVLMYSDAWTQNITSVESSQIRLELAQMPYNPGRAWIGLSDEERGNDPTYPEWHRSPLSVVFALIGECPQLIDESEHPTNTVLAGIMIDEWSELVPAKQVNTSIAFQYDAPNAQAPQALLLAVPSQINDITGLWKPSDIANIVSDTIELAKVRAVDIDALAGEENDNSDSEPWGSILPSIYLPYDSENPGWLRDITMNNITDWLNELVVKQETCITGTIDNNELTDVNGVTWRIIFPEEMPRFSSVRGLFYIVGATVELKGNAIEATREFEVIDYSVIEYPPGFIQETHEGSTHVTGPSINPGLYLLSNTGDDVELYGGLSLEAVRIMSDLRLIGHRLEGTDNFWIDELEYLGNDYIGFGFVFQGFEGVYFQTESGALYRLSASDRFFDRVLGDGEWAGAKLKIGGGVTPASSGSSTTSSDGITISTGTTSSTSASEPLLTVSLYGVVREANLIVNCEGA